MWQPQSQTSHSPWRPKDWSQDLPKPRWPFFITWSTCVMARSDYMLAGGEDMSPRMSQLGPSYPSQLGKMRRHWNAAHTPEIKDPTLWSSTCTLMRSLRTTGVWNCAPIGPFWRAASLPMNLRLPMAVLGSVGRRKSRHGPCLLCWGSMAINSPWSSCGMPGRTSPLLWKDTAEDNVVVERKELKTALLKGRRSRRRPWISWNRCSCQSQPRWRSGVWFGEKLGHCWQPSTSSATRRFLWWICRWQMWLIPRSSSASEPCAMRGSPSPLRSSVPLRRSMPSWSPMCSPAPMWKWRWHGDATRSNGGGQRLTLPMLGLFIASWTTPMRPFGLLVWIQTCQLGLLRWVQLPSALTPRQGLLCWWNILISHAPPSPLKMWTLWWARIPKRR